MTAAQMNASYRKKLFTDPQFRRLTMLAETENAKRERECFVMRELIGGLLNRKVTDRMSQESAAVMRELDCGTPVHLDRLQQVAGCDRHKLHKTVAMLKAGGRIEHAGVGQWKLARTQPKRHAPGRLMAIVLDNLNGHPVSVKEISIAEKLPRQSVRQALMVLERDELAVRKDGGWLKATE